MVQAHHTMDVKIMTCAQLQTKLKIHGVTARVTKANRVEYEEQLLLIANGHVIDAPDQTISKDLDEIVAKLKEHNLSLREHQIAGLNEIWKWHALGRGGILGDEMGLGKTCTAIIHLLRLRMQKRGPFTITCPLSVVDHWVAEIERFGLGMLKPVPLAGNELLDYFKKNTTITKDTVIIVAHVHIERLNGRNNGVSKYRTQPYDMVVVDEAQRAKSAGLRLHNLLSNMKTRFLLLTGTPIQNSLYELHSLLTLIDNKRFASNKAEEFKDKYSENLGELHDILSEYFLRRTKELVCKDIPPLEQVIFYHGMSDVQTKLYFDVLHTDHSVVSAKKYNSLDSLMMALRKVVAHPYLMHGQEPEPFTEGEHLVDASDKLRVIDRLIKFLLDRNHSVLIFSQFVIFLDIVEDYLNLRGLEFSRLDGSMNREDRGMNVNAFSRSTSKKGPRIFLLSTRAGGLGLNLINADTVLFCDSDWNPQCDLQAMARCHRIGQTKPVRVIRLIGRYTVEQYQHAKARSKLALTAQLIGGEAAPPKGVSILEYVHENKEKLRNGKYRKSNLSDATIEKVVGGTDRAGHWRPIEENDINEVEVINHVDDADKADVDVMDYRTYQGKKFRVEARDREELEQHIHNMMYSGTRATGTVNRPELLDDREKRLEILIKKNQERAAKRVAKRLSVDSNEENVPLKTVKVENSDVE